MLRPMKSTPRTAPILLAGLAISLGGLAASATPARAGELHDVKAEPAKATLGAPAKASVTLSAKNGWHLNPDAPVTLKLTAPEGVTVEKPKLGRPDLAASTPESARFDVAFTAKKPGPASIGCEASFVICQASACKPVKETLALAIDVADAKAAGDKAAGDKAEGKPAKKHAKKQ